MRYANIITNDVVNGEGVCVSLFMQGCPHKCKGCFNQETWDFNGGKEESINAIVNQIINAIDTNRIQRNFSILGGEPLCTENRYNVLSIIDSVRNMYPNIKIFLWTGYTMENLIEIDDYCTNKILEQLDFLIDGPYIESERDLTLKWRGSRNQRILTKNEINDIINKSKKEEEIK